MSEISARKLLVRDNYVESVLQDLNYTKENPYSKRLIITIPGTPVVDGRPRENRKLEVFYNEKKAFLKKIFGEVYKRDRLLQNICITTPHQVSLFLYYLPTKDELNFLSTEELLDENVDSISSKDNDNVEKVHYDVLQDGEFMITLNDSHMSRNGTRKFYSVMPRTVIYIDFNDAFMHPLYKHKIEKSMPFKMLKMSKKYNIDMRKFDKISAVKNIISVLGDVKTTDRKKLKYVYGGYSAEIINELYRWFKFGRLTPCENERDEIFIKRLKGSIKIDFIIENSITKKKSKSKTGDDVA